MASSDAPSHAALYSGSVSLAATTFVSGTTCGIMTSLYSVCMYSLIRELRSKSPRKRTALLTVWVTALWILSTISTIANAYCSIYAYSWQMDYPEGPAAYLAHTWNKPIPVLASTTYLLTMWLADAMMLWRLVVFYHGVYPLARGAIFSLMFLVYLGILGTGCYMLAILGENRTLYSDFTKKAAIPCFALSVTLNVFATAFISIRLFLFKKQTERTLGREVAQASPYTSIAAMVIESSVLYATWSLVFIIVYGIGNPGQTVLLMSLCNVQVIAPVLIVYRVSRGVGWERSTSARLTSTHLVFSGNQEKSDTVYDPEYQDSFASDMKMIFATRSQATSNATDYE